MVSMPWYSPGGDVGDVTLIGFLGRMLLECTEGLKLVTFGFSVWGLGSMKGLALPGDTGGLGVTMNELGLVSLGWMLPLEDSTELLLLVLLSLEMPDLCFSRSLAAISRARGEVAASFPLEGSLVFKFCSLRFSKGLYFRAGSTGVRWIMS